MPCRDCLSRREFLTKSAAAAAVLVAADACGDGQIGPPQISGPDPLKPPGGPVQVKLSDFPALANTNVIVDIGRVGPDRTVMRTGATTFLALSRICSHQQCTIDIKTDHYECPCHLSAFTSTGAVIHGPNVASPPIGPLRQLAVSFDAATQTLTVE